MPTCTFFGHRTINKKIEPILQSTLIDLIEKHNVDLFYLGSQGDFDFKALNVLTKLKARYPHIDFFVVLTHLPTKNENFNFATIYPKILATSPAKFAIDRRNHWMLNRSDYVISYIEHSIGGAAKFMNLAIRKNKKVVNIAEKEKS